MPNKKKKAVAGKESPVKNPTAKPLKGEGSGVRKDVGSSKRPSPVPMPTKEGNETFRGQRRPAELSIETFEASPPRELTKGDTDKKPFFSGNPFVEKTEGLLHIYKKNEMTSLLEDDGKRSEMLCMLAVPATLTVQDLLSFIAPCASGIQKIRIIRDSSPNQYMVLLRFREQQMADGFYRNYDGMAFNSLEPNSCHLVYVAQIETMKESDGPGFPVEGHTELPTCPVCLERMDESVDGILTILCNHSFHGVCLSQWGDTSCPVCRYCQTPEQEQDNKCFTCGKHNELWICLICGHVGCGRYEGAHAFEHFKETSHTFSLQMGTRRVWDYAGDNYVHRLIQTKEDGKVVEYEPFSRNPADVEGEEKIEGITLEYTYLLTNQLESQRRFFEGKMQTIEKMAHAQMEELEGQMRRVVDDCESFKKELKSLNEKKNQAEKKLQQTSTKLDKATSELKEEQLMNKVLRGEQQKWAGQVKDLQQKLKESEEARDKEASMLREELRDLMFHLEGREKLENEGGEAVPEDELRESTLAIGEPAGGGRKQRKKKK